MAKAVPATGVGSPRCCHRGAAPLTSAAACGAVWRGVREVGGVAAGVREEGRRHRQPTGGAGEGRARPAGRRLRWGLSPPEVWEGKLCQCGGALRVRERRTREHPPAGLGERGGGAAGGGQGRAAQRLPHRAPTRRCVGRLWGAPRGLSQQPCGGGKAAPAEVCGEEAAAGAVPTFPLLTTHPPPRPPAWAGGERRGDARRWRLCSAAERRRRSRCGRQQPAPLRGRPCPPLAEGGSARPQASGTLRWASFWVGPGVWAHHGSGRGESGGPRWCCTSRGFKGGADVPGCQWSP